MTDTPRVAKCSICGKPADPKFRPFCSRRCADIDLGRWLNDSYVVPGDGINSPAGAGQGEDFDEE